MPVTLLCSLYWLWFRLAGWLPCWERACHSALRVCCRTNVMLCSVQFLSQMVSRLGLNLIASIPGSPFLTLHSFLSVLHLQCVIYMIVSFARNVAPICLLTVFLSIRVFRIHYPCTWHTCTYSNFFTDSDGRMGQKIYILVFFIINQNLWLLGKDCMFCINMNHMLHVYI